MGFGLRPGAKAPDEPPSPTGYAPPLDSTEVALVVEHAVEHEGRVAVGALDRTAVERGVVVGDEGVELEGDEARAVSPLQHLLRHGEALADVVPSPQWLAASRREMPWTMAASAARWFSSTRRQSLTHLSLLHGVEAEVAAVGEDRGQQRADLAGVDPLARLLEVDAEPEVVLDLDEQVGEPDRLLAGPGDLTAGRRAGLPVRPPICSGMSARSNGRTSSSTARSRSASIASQVHVSLLFGK